MNRSNNVDLQTIGQFIKEIGFPCFVAVYLLLSLRPAMEKIHNELVTIKTELVENKAVLAEAKNEIKASETEIKESEKEIQQGVARIGSFLKEFSAKFV